MSEPRTVLVEEQVPYCCHPTCYKDAEFEIRAMGEGVDFYDITHACEDHVGALLGSITDTPADHWIVQPRIGAEFPWECHGWKKCPWRKAKQEGGQR